MKYQALFSLKDKNKKDKNKKQQQMTSAASLLGSFIRIKQDVFTIMCFCNLYKGRQFGDLFASELNPIQNGGYKENDRVNSPESLLSCLEFTLISLRLKEQ